MRLLSADVIRRCLIADPGHSILTADYDQVEWRVIAALAGEQSMIEAAKKGESIHKLTAVRLFGTDYTPDQYKLTKNVNFTWAFGGGASTMTRRYGVPLPVATALIKDYERAFPALVSYKKRQQDLILHSALNRNEYAAFKRLRSQMFNFRSDTPEGKRAQAAVRSEINKLCYRKTGRVITPFGRSLIVDAQKPYTVVNYVVQSSAADIMKQGFLRVMDIPELEPTVLLIIHDELLGQAPKRRAERVAQRYAEVMTTEFQGVPITASGKVYGMSWGHGYRKSIT